MKLTEFPTYEDANSGKVIEFGVKTFIADKLLQQNEKSIEVMSDILSKSFARAILQNMKKVTYSGRGTTFHAEIRRDPTLVANEYVAIVESVSLVEPKQYIAEAYKSWMILKNELEYWQQKSLWQFINYWWIRKTRPIREKIARWKYKEEF